MSQSLNNTEEDVMDLLSVSDNLELTREEENSLLGENAMAIDSPLKSTADSADEAIKGRKSIVFDLAADDDNENDDEIRNKFRTERKTINFSLNETNKRQIPDSLDGLGKRDNNYKRVRETDPVFRRRRKRTNGSRNANYRDRQRVGRQRGDGSVDLRQLINAVKQQNNQQSNPFPLNQGLTPLMNYQMNLGILNPMAAQNQMLSALLSQTAANPLLNRLSIGGQNLSVVNSSVKKPKDNIQITVINENKVSSGSTNSTKTQTRSQIRCRVTDVDTNDSTDCDTIENGVPSILPKAPTTQKRQMSTLFAKHIAAKVNQTKAPPQSTGVVSGDFFGDALAEVEVGVDNDYLRRMQEQEKKRLELQRLKEQRRLEMSDERLESALRMKQKIGNQRNY